MSVPFAGMIMRLIGYHRVHAKSMKKLMGQKKILSILPGGFEQATITSRDQCRVFIKQRKGFIKYSLKFNYTLYPVLFLNENKLFWTFTSFLNFRLWLNKLKIPSALFFHPKYLWFVPTDMNFTTVVGKGIKGRHFEEGEEPSQQQIDETHAAYIQEIKRIHEKYKEISGVPLAIF